MYAAHFLRRQSCGRLDLALALPYNAFVHAFSASMNFLRIASYFFLLVSVVLMCFCIEMVVSNTLLRQHGVKVQGEVAEIIAEPDSEGRTLYSPVYTFREVATQQEHCFRSSLSSGKTSLRPGDRVEIIYPEGAPKKARANTFSDFYFGALLLGVFACGSGVGGMGLRYIARHGNAESLRVLSAIPISKD